MWVPAAVWQPCKLLHTCYLLTYVYLANCLRSPLSRKFRLGAVRVSVAIVAKFRANRFRGLESWRPDFSTAFRSWSPLQHVQYSLGVSWIALADTDGSASSEDWRKQVNSRWVPTARWRHVQATLRRVMHGRLWMVGVRLRTHHARSRAVFLDREHG